MIGRNLRRVREDVQEGTQAELTDRLRAFGLNWNRSQVAKAERGERAFTIEQVALIAAALDIDIAELVRAEPEERVALSPAATCDAEFLVALFDATAPDHRQLRLPHLDCPQTQHWATNAKTVSFPTPTEAEERLARKLGTTPDRVGQAALALWRRPFVEEREQRLADRVTTSATDAEPPPVPKSRPASSPTEPKRLVEPARLRRAREGVRSVAAQRGHVTRELLDEIRPILETPVIRRSRARRGKDPSITKDTRMKHDLENPPKSPRR